MKPQNASLLTALIVALFSFAYLFVVDYVIADVVQANPNDYSAITLPVVLLTLAYFGAIWFLQNIIERRRK
jgi:hypothetical protein